MVVFLALFPVVSGLKNRFLPVRKVPVPAPDQDKKSAFRATVRLRRPPSKVSRPQRLPPRRTRRRGRRS